MRQRRARQTNTTSAVAGGLSEGVELPSGRAGRPSGRTVALVTHGRSAHDALSRPRAGRLPRHMGGTRATPRASAHTLLPVHVSPSIRDSRQTAPAGHEQGPARCGAPPSRVAWGQELRASPCGSKRPGGRGSRSTWCRRRPCCARVSPRAVNGAKCISSLADGREGPRGVEGGRDTAGAEAVPVPGQSGQVSPQNPRGGGSG